MTYRSSFNKRCFHLTLCAFKNYSNWYYSSNMNRHPGMQGLQNMFQLKSVNLFTLGTLTVALCLMWSQIRGCECLCHHIQNDWENGESVHCILSTPGKYCKQMNSGEDSMSRTLIFERFCCFTEGWQLVESNKHPSQLLMRRNSDRTDKVCALFKRDRRLMTREISKEVSPKKSKYS